MRRRPAARSWVRSAPGAVIGIGAVASGTAADQHAAPQRYGLRSPFARALMPAIPGPTV